MDLHTKVVHDGVKNASVQVTGRGPFSWTVVVDASELRPVPRDIRIDAVYYAIADKTEVMIGWGDSSGNEYTAPMLPLGGRGRIDFAEVSGLHNIATHSNGDIMIRAYGEGLFTLVLDLSKHTGN